jgi:hypothetical protein
VDFVLLNERCQQKGKSGREAHPMKTLFVVLFCPNINRYNFQESPLANKTNIICLSVFNTILGIQTYSAEQQDDKIIMNWEGCGEKGSLTNLVHYPGFS